ncbi:MAG: coproporphyrinogen III oxidase, partial [Proteiniphilum sp.]
QERYNEFILTGLRTMWGINLQELEKRFGVELLDYCMNNVQPYLNRGLVRQEGSKLILTREGFFISDGIMSDLMRVD